MWVRIPELRIDPLPFGSERKCFMMYAVDINERMPKNERKRSCKPESC